MATISSGTWLNLDGANARGAWDARAASGINDNGKLDKLEGCEASQRPAAAALQPASAVAGPFLAAQMGITASMMHLAVVPMLALSASFALWRLGGGLTLTHARAGLAFSGLLGQPHD